MVEAEIVSVGDPIRVRLCADRSLIEWPPVRHDLGFDDGGPEPVAGVELIEEVEREPGRVSEVAGTVFYDAVVLSFEDFDALASANGRLHHRARCRLADRDTLRAEDVLDVAIALPSPYDVARRCVDEWMA